MFRFVDKIDTLRSKCDELSSNSHKLHQPRAWLQQHSPIQLRMSKKKKFSCWIGQTSNYPISISTDIQQKRFTESES
jgi:hypothetical protein